MSFEPSDPVDLVPATTRVGNGRVARLIALAVAGILVGVVAIAFANRPPPPPPPVAVATTTPEPPATAAPQPTPVPSPSPMRNQIEGNDGILGWAVVEQLPFRPPWLPALEPRSYSYTVSIAIAGGLLRTALEPNLAEVYSGSVLIDSRDVGKKLVIDLGRQWEEHGLIISEAFGFWEVELKRLRKSRGGLVELLVEHVPPALTLDAGPSPVANGYTLTVLGRREGSRLTLFVELVWPAVAQRG
jgi:hypothetical protein